jgi:hypothetical protein
MAPLARIHGDRHLFLEDRHSQGWGVGGGGGRRTGVTREVEGWHVARQKRREMAWVYRSMDKKREGGEHRGSGTEWLSLTDVSLTI